MATPTSGRRTCGGRLGGGWFIMLDGRFSFDEMIMSSTESSDFGAPRKDISPRRPATGTTPAFLLRDTVLPTSTSPVPFQRALDVLPVRISSRLIESTVPSVILGTPCWWASGRVNRNGYKRAFYAGREQVLHRVVYEILVASIPPKLVLDHLCRCRDCCNPSHLEAVTISVNTRRGNAILFKKTPV